MITTGAILNGPRERLLEYDPFEQPLAIQLGGSDPNALAECSKIAEQEGYCEVNLNVGCPSDRVQGGDFGACLMLKPDQIAKCIEAMSKAVSIPVTVKTRLGVDHNDSYEELRHFIKTVKDGGCNFFIMHARKAWLKGLSPKENRTIPPLMYETVYKLIEDFPECQFELNGGLIHHNQFEREIVKVGSIMLGRVLWDNPWILHDLDQRYCNKETAPYQKRSDCIKDYLPYIEKELERGTAIQHLLAPLLGFYHQVPGSRKWRQFISTQRKPDVNILSKLFSLAESLDANIH